MYAGVVILMGYCVSSIVMPNELLKTDLEFGNGIVCYSEAYTGYAG